MLEKDKKIGMRKVRVLVFVGSFLPGTNSAGVTTSLTNLIEGLNDFVEFYIMTEDRDIGDKEPYRNVPLECWTEYGNAKVFYSRKYIQSLTYLKKIIRSLDFDAYYFNGFYNIKDNFRPFLLYILKRIPQKPIVVAPRGIFSMGEYDNRLLLRKFYRMFINISGLTNKIKWHVTAELEKQDVLKKFPNVENNITVIPNLSSMVISTTSSILEKKKGFLKIIFISRISPKKNIKFIFDILKEMKGNVQFNIYGMIGTDEEKNYWKECEEIIKTMPKNVSIEYHGAVPHNMVPDLFKNHHLFFFPTFGENYGHVIAESLACGCPILLSDTTPWNTIELCGAGWIIPLNQKQKYIKTLQFAIDMDNNSWTYFSNKAIELYLKEQKKEDAINTYKSFFQSLINIDNE